MSEALTPEQREILDRLHAGRDLWESPYIPGLMREVALLALLKLLVRPEYGRIELTLAGRAYMESIRPV